MYLSTAFVTGLILGAMFLVDPQNLWLGRLILVTVALLVLFGSVPMRKGIAIALDYWVEERWNADV